MVGMRHVCPGSIRSDLYLISESWRPGRGDGSPPIISVVSSLLRRLVARNEHLPLLPSSSPPPLGGALSSPSSSSPSSPVAPSASSSSSSSSSSTSETLCLSPGAGDKKWRAFSGSRVPTISIEQYLERIFEYADCSPSCFVVAYVYLDRMMTRQHLHITSLSVHRLLITTVMLAAKFLDDICYDNAFYAKIGGLSTQEMNKLELSFLFLMDFRMQVTVSVFESYCSHLEREVALGGGYQIERTLTSICGLVHKASQDANTNTTRGNANSLPTKKRLLVHSS